MSRPAAPSMPTTEQIRKAHEAVAELYPGARIAKVGPDGVTFTYPDAAVQMQEQWTGRPFSAEGA